MASLGEEIKKLRDARDWSQTQLASKSGIDASTLSRLESGQIKNTSKDNIKKLEKALEVPTATLTRLSQETSKDTESALLRIGFGHCIWAAPIIAMVMEGRMAGLRITSYGYKQEGDDETAFLPFWYDSDNLKRSKRIKAGPSYVKCTDVDKLPNIDNWDSKETKLRTFAADDLIDLLQAEELDCIMVPGELFVPYRSLLIRCAHVMNTVRSGCSLIAVGNDLNKNFKDFSALFKNVQSVVNGPQIMTFFVKGTIAEKHLNFYLGTYLKELRQNYIELGNWEVFWPQLKETLETEGGFFFIGWEPHLTWIKKAVKELNKGFSSIEVELPDYIPRNVVSDKREQYLTFDIMFKKTSKFIEDFSLNKTLRNFFALLETSILTISNAPNKQSPIVRLIAKYLDMKSDDCYQALSSLNFALRFFPEWIEYMQGY
jgi:transcriptional regulator with XRE-family HTH domain